MNGPQKSSSRTSPLFVVLAVALALLAAYAFLSSSPAVEADEDSVRPSAADVVSVSQCSAPSEQARARATELERLARAHWERVPFDEAELLLSVTHMHEAEHCYALAQDREGRLRAESGRALFMRELRARIERHRVRLEVARREGNLSAIEGQATALLALYSRATDDSAAYRERLAQIARRARAEALEARTRNEEQSP